MPSEHQTVDANSPMLQALIERDGGEVLFDGILADQVIDNGPDLPNAIGWSIAKSDGSGYGGLIDELRVTTSALTPHQFLLYDQGCPGDFTMDGFVNMLDLARFAGYWMGGEQLFDIAPAPSDGIIETQDLQLIAENWLNICN